MPTYQYVCTACGRDLEAVQSFSDAALTECPTCSGLLRKKFGSVGVVFKGSGFYRNDSRSSATSSTAAAPSEKGESKADGKPASGDKPSGGDKPTGGDKPAAKKETSSSSSSGSSGSTSSAA